MHYIRSRISVLHVVALVVLVRNQQRNHQHVALLAERVIIQQRNQQKSHLLVVLLVALEISNSLFIKLRACLF